MGVAEGGTATKYYTAHAIVLATSSLVIVDISYIEELIANIYRQSLPHIRRKRTTVRTFKITELIKIVLNKTEKKILSFRKGSTYL